MPGRRTRFFIISLLGLAAANSFSALCVANGRLDAITTRVTVGMTMKQAERVAGNPDHWGNAILQDRSYSSKSAPKDHYIVSAQLITEKYNPAHTRTWVYLEDGPRKPAMHCLFLDFDEHGTLVRWHTGYLDGVIIP